MGLFGIFGKNNEKNNDELQKLRRMSNSDNTQRIKEYADKIVGADKRSGSTPSSIYSDFTIDDESAWIFINGIGDILKNLDSTLTQEGAVFILNEYYAMSEKRAKEIYKYFNVEPPLAKKG